MGYFFGQFYDYCDGRIDDDNGFSATAFFGGPSVLGINEFFVWEWAENFLSITFCFDKDDIEILSVVLAL